MATPLNIQTSSPAREPHSISLKDRVVRSLSLRRGARSKAPSTSDKDAKAIGPASALSVSDERPSRGVSMDIYRRPGSSSGGGRTFGFGTSFGSGSSSKPSSPLASSSYTADPFEGVTVSPSAHDLTGAHKPSSSSIAAAAMAGAGAASGGATSRNLAVPPSPSFGPKKRTGAGHGHSQSTSGIGMLARSLSRSKYLGGGGSGSGSNSSYKDGATTGTASGNASGSGTGSAEQRQERVRPELRATKSDFEDSFVLSPPSPVTSSQQQRSLGKGQPPASAAGRFKHGRSQSKPVNGFYSPHRTHVDLAGRRPKMFDDDEVDADGDSASLASSRRPLLRSRSFDSLVPSLLGDHTPYPRIVIESTARAKPLERLSAPPTKENVFAIKRTPWGMDDHEDDEVLLDEEILASSVGAGDGSAPARGGTAPPAGLAALAATDDARASRDRAQTAEGRLGLPKSSTKTSSGSEAMEYITEDVSDGPVVALPISIGPGSQSLPVSGASTSGSGSLPKSGGGSGALAFTPPTRSPGTSPGLNAARITGGGGGGGGGLSAAAQERALREHWTRELEGKSGPFIVVERGWKKGIYSSGEEAAKQVRDFPGPKVRKVETAAEAIDIIAAHQPVAPSPTTAEGLLARTGSLRKMNMASSYGPAGARASRYLGLDAASEESSAAAATATAPTSSSPLEQTGPAVPPKPRSKDVAGTGQSYAARRAARLRAQAEAEAAAAAAGEARGTASHGSGEDASSSSPHPNVDAVSSRRDRDDGGKASQAYGRGSMDSARVLNYHDSNQPSSTSRPHRHVSGGLVDGGGGAYGGGPGTRDRTRSGTGLKLSFSGGHAPQDAADRHRPATAMSRAASRQGKAAELEYGLLDHPSSAVGGRRERERGASGSGGGSGATPFGMAYANALGATVTVQRAHTISGAR